MDLRRVAWLWCLSALVLRPIWCYNHWVVTEDGKIEHQTSSPFNLLQHFDLMALIQQEERVSTLKELKEELIDYKNEFEGFSGYKSFDESYRALDPECRSVKLISTYDLYVSTVLPLKHKGVDIHAHIGSPSSRPPSPGEPHCTSSPLDFSMAAMEHLTGVQGRRGLVAPPEKSVLSSVEMRMELFGSLVHHALEKNSSSWVLLNMATLYWRARGNPFHAIECIRRSLHYSPFEQRDLALLNLANILHRSHHSSDAATALRVAISHSPNISVLYFTLGNVYAALDQVNESVRYFRHCLELDPTGKMSREMYFASVCEHRMNVASRERTEKLDDTQNKLDIFYKIMELVHKHQHPGGGVSSILEPEPKENGHDSEKRKQSPSTEGKANLNRDTPSSLDPVSDDVSSLERDLDEALKSEKDSIGDKDTRKSQNGTARRRPKIILTPLPADSKVTTTTEPPTTTTKTDQSDSLDTPISGTNLKHAVLFPDQCPNIYWRRFPGNQFCCPLNHSDPSSDLCDDQDADTGKGVEAGREEEGVACSLEQPHDELAIFDQIDAELNIKDATKATAPALPPPKKEYPQDYHTLEFLSYNPLPDRLEDVIFPKDPDEPVPLYHDPYWPRKKECLELVSQLRRNPYLIGFTGTFIAPEARGVSVSALFSSIPASLPKEWRRLPKCPEIMDLPLSMASMDHLDPISYRANFRRNENTGEKGLKKALITIATGNLNVEFSLEESAQRVYVAMMQHPAHWALFSIASLYWRVMGNPTQAIECLRRAVQYAPRTAQDVGYIGLANVLLRQGYWNEAIIMTRAALDISERSVESKEEILDQSDMDDIELRAPQVSKEKQTLTSSSSTDKAAHFPYLNAENLTEKQKKRLEVRLANDSDRQRNRFAILVDKTRESLERQNKACNDLSVLVLHSTKNRLFDLIQDSKSIRELFFVLADYWSFFDYEFLRLIIERFCDDLKPDLTSYESSLKDYCRRRLCELPDDVFAKKGDGHNLYVKIDSHFNAAKVEDINKLEVRLSELLKTELYVLKVEEGCIFVTFTNLCDISTPLTLQQIKTLKEMKILHLYSDTEEYFNSSTYLSDVPVKYNNLTGVKVAKKKVARQERHGQVHIKPLVPLNSLAFFLGIMIGLLLTMLIDNQGLKKPIMAMQKLKPLSMLELAQYNISIMETRPECLEQNSSRALLSSYTNCDMMCQTWDKHYHMEKQRHFDFRLHCERLEKSYLTWPPHIHFTINGRVDNRTLIFEAVSNRSLKNKTKNVDHNIRYYSRYVYATKQCLRGSIKKLIAVSLNCALSEHDRSTYYVHAIFSENCSVISIIMWGNSNLEEIVASHFISCIKNLIAISQSNLIPSKHDRFAYHVHTIFFKNYANCLLMKNGNSYLEVIVTSLSNSHARWYISNSQLNHIKELAYHRFDQLLSSEIWVHDGSLDRLTVKQRYLNVTISFKKPQIFLAFNLYDQPWQLQCRRYLFASQECELACHQFDRLLPCNAGTSDYLTQQHLHVMLSFKPKNAPLFHLYWRPWQIRCCRCLIKESTAVWVNSRWYTLTFAVFNSYESFACENSHLEEFVTLRCCSHAFSSNLYISNSQLVYFSIQPLAFHRFDRLLSCEALAHNGSLYCLRVKWQHLNVTFFSILHQRQCSLPLEQWLRRSIKELICSEHDWLPYHVHTESQVKVLCVKPNSQEIVTSKSNSQVRWKLCEPSTFSTSWTWIDNNCVLFRYYLFAGKID